MSRGPYGDAGAPPARELRRRRRGPLSPLRRAIVELFPAFDEGASAGEQLDELIADALLDDTWPDDPDHDERNCRQCQDGAR